MFTKLFFKSLLLTIGMSNVAAAYEEARHQVVETNAQYEIREYDSLLVAEVVVDADAGESNNSAFRILFDYISGNNIAQQEIAMTTPVIQQAGEGESIAMTTPVLQTRDSESNSNYRFSFVMPATYTIDTLPLPRDERISIVEVPPKRVAVRRYSGSWSERNYRNNEASLLEALQRSGITIVGEPMYARYNSPFTLWFLRRNEVMVEIAG